MTTKTRLIAINEAISILRIEGYTLNNDAYLALVKEKGLLEGTVMNTILPKMEDILPPLPISDEQAAKNAENDLYPNNEAGAFDYMDNRLKHGIEDRWNKAVQNTINLDEWNDNEKDPRDEYLENNEPELSDEEQRVADMLIAQRDSDFKRVSNFKAFQEAISDEDIDDEDIDDEAGEREYMKAEAKNRDLTEDERIIYNL